MLIIQNHHIISSRETIVEKKYIKNLLTFFYFVRKKHCYENIDILIVRRITQL